MKEHPRSEQNAVCVSVSNAGKVQSTGCVRALMSVGTCLVFECWF